MTTKQNVCLQKHETKKAEKRQIWTKDTTTAKKNTKKQQYSGLEIRHCDSKPLHRYASKASMANTTVEQVRQYDSKAA
jgi:hypothetical protein